MTRLDKARASMRELKERIEEQKRFQCERNAHILREIRNLLEEQIPEMVAVNEPLATRPGLTSEDMRWSIPYGNGRIIIEHTAKVPNKVLIFKTALCPTEVVELGSGSSTVRVVERLCGGSAYSDVGYFPIDPFDHPGLVGTNDGGSAPRDHERMMRERATHEIIEHIARLMEME